ncbi:tRNA lysidine(34) synthetase TilS [Variovorax sp. PCZ-1]|nr:tRNA lysidine(34) synthetase TilS [Variovorax sp. PCZ-1]MBS7806999.1 tRNA lysidine(34) synthetase TilS [Variovorax sp. PCZ-1]
MGKMLGLPPPYIVAYSGGADSTALLLIALEAAPGKVSAVHVHHGLQAAADDFAAHCEAFCAERGVPLTVLRVNAKAAAGQSPEDAARRARYAAISEHIFRQKHLISGVEYAQSATELIVNQPTVLLAQHADDQVETLLLALSRGAGVDGLAGMAAEFERYGVQWARPFLSLESFMGAQQIRAWLAERGLEARQPGSGNLGQGWVEDPTNQSLDFTRNRIRAKLLPALQQVFPQYRETFARSARNMAQAGELLAQAAMDLVANVGMPPQIKALQTLSRVAQANYLRHWLKSQHGSQGSEAQMNELLDQIAACTTRGHQIRIKVAQGYVLRDGDKLKFETPN